MCDIWSIVLVFPTQLGDCFLVVVTIYQFYASTRFAGFQVGLFQNDDQTRP